MDAVLLDMDGLMIDSEGYYWDAERALARRHGKTVSDQTLLRMMGHSPAESIGIFKAEVGLEASSAELLAERDAAVLARLEAEVEAQPGLIELLERLHGRVLLAVVTGAPRSFVDVVLERLELGHHFTLIQTSDDVTHGKPDPEIYLTAARKLGVDPARCAVLEDSVNGARAGKRAGAYTIAVPSAQAEGQDFSFCDHAACDLLAAACQLERLLLQV